MTVTTEDGGRYNLYAKEPQMKVMEVIRDSQRTRRTTKWSRLAMLGCYRSYWRLRSVQQASSFQVFFDWNNGFYSGPTINLGIRW